MNNGTGWVSLADWENIVLPFILAEIPKASGMWHIKSAAELTEVLL